MVGAVGMALTKLYAGFLIGAQGWSIPASEHADQSKYSGTEGMTPEPTPGSELTETAKRQVATCRTCETRGLYVRNMRDFDEAGPVGGGRTTGMAASSHPAATLAALNILRAGGNAVDAAIAAVALQGVIDPHMTGIGRLLRPVLAAGSTPIALNGSGRSPAAVTLDHYIEQGLSAIPDDMVDADQRYPGAPSTLGAASRMITVQKVSKKCSHRRSTRRRRGSS